jgi:hypothetical protein
MGLMKWLKRENTTVHPQNPQTGDGRTRRDIYDKPRVTQREASGKAIPPPPLPPVKPKRKRK